MKKHEIRVHWLANEIRGQVWYLAREEKDAKRKERIKKIAKKLDRLVDELWPAESMGV